MKSQLIGLYFCIGSMWIPSTFAAESGAKTGQPPALPMGDADATRLTDIHDIKPALALSPDLQWLLYWVLAIAAVLVLAAFAWRLWQKRKKPAAAKIATPPIPAETEAYRMLDALATDENLNPKQFYFSLSAILRRYIERRYEIPAAEMTTEELLPKVDRLPLSIELAQPLKAFCRGADPIKFAGAAANPNRMAHDLSFARDFVRQTTEVLKTATGNGGQKHPTAASHKRLNDLTQ